MMDFLYTVDATADEPIMLIDRHIGFDEGDGIGIMGDYFQRELLALDAMGKSRIKVWINSPGGSVVDGYAIYNAILKSTTKVDTYCFGIAASIAAVIFQAGRKRIMADYGILMYHNPFGGSDDAALQKIKKSLQDMICSRSGMTDKQCDEMMNRTTYMDAMEAMGLKLCDEIEVSGDYNKKRLAPVKSNAKAFWHEARNILNKQFENSPAMSNNMLKTTLVLGLTEGVPEDAIVKAIKEVQDKAYTAEAEIIVLNKKAKDESDAAKKKMDALQEEMDSLKEELKKKKQEFDDCKNELNSMKDAKDAAEKEAKASTAKNMVEGFAKIGKIKNEADVIAKWTAKAVENLEETKALLEDLPLNKKAETIQIENKLGEGELPTTAAVLMAKNRAARLAAR